MYILQRYTYNVAIEVQLRFLFFFIRKKFPSDFEQIKETEDAFFRGKILLRDVLDKFKLNKVFLNMSTESLVQSSKNVEQLLTLTNTRPAVCVICQVKAATCHIVHGTSTHKCVCSECAVRHVLNGKTKCRCPTCNEHVDEVILVPQAPVCGSCKDARCKIVLVTIENTKGIAAHEASEVFETTECMAKKFMETPRPGNVATVLNVF